LIAVNKNYADDSDILSVTDEVSTIAVVSDGWFYWI